MISDIVDNTWDVIVIGAGLGGGVVGRRLSEKGLSVLFLDCGPHRLRKSVREPTSGTAEPAATVRTEYAPAPLHAVIDGRHSTFAGSAGIGVGGSSLVYAASLERPARHDLDDSEDIRHPTGGWPVGYDRFSPYFETVEKLFHVCGDTYLPTEGGPTRLLSAPPMSKGDADQMERFRRKGLQPYRIPVGIRYSPGCQECLGRECPQACKMDGLSAGVDPALATGRAALLDRCEITALAGQPGRITHVEAMRDGERLRFSARCFILSAGGLESPRLLLASASATWPNGCANESGLVGRNLMFHLNERIAVWSDRGADFAGPAKTLSLRDFYYHDGMRLGLFQSMGLQVSYGELVQYMIARFDRSRLRSLRPIRELTRIPAFAAVKALGTARVFAGILEDLPYETNRIALDERRPGRASMQYKFAPELLQRRRAFRRIIKSAVRGQRSLFLNTEPELNLGHPCGTLRFGRDAGSSVLDPSCRAHSVQNLYVADASFMPTSCGVNPGLIIASNALRVADQLIDDVPSGRLSTGH